MEFKLRQLGYTLFKFILIIALLHPTVIGGCINGYMDVDPESKYCFLLLYLQNKPNDEDQRPDEGKTWIEAEKLCQDFGGGTLARFQSQSEFRKLLDHFQSHYVIRDMFRDKTTVRGVYFPDNSSLCPEPPIGCAIWYFGLKKDPSTKDFRYYHI